MRSARWLLILPLWFAFPALAEEIVSIPMVDYVHDQYDNACLSDTAGYLARLKPYPPEILQVGKIAPFVHSYGPVAGYGGENQGFGGWATRTEFARFLTPDELRGRIAELQRFTSGAKAAGVKYVMPYGCMLTYFGNPEQRLGMHQLYDHWDEYGEWLGPRPPLPPEDWLARNADGTPWFFYGSRKDFYEPYWRFTTCIQNPGWRAWMAAYIKNLVAAGYNGVMLDNVCKMRCLCSHCQARFQQVLRDKYTPEQFRERFGLDDYSKLTLMARTPEATIEGHARAGLIEVLQFELFNCVDWLRFIRAEGRKHDPNFSVCCNISHIRHIEEAYGEADMALVEGHGWWGPYAGLGLAGQYYPGRLVRAEGDRVFTNAFNCAVVHLIPGEHRAYLMQKAGAEGADALPNADTVLLSYAESAALAGGRATPMPFYSTPFARAPSYDETNWARWTWFDFARRNQSALVGLHREPPIGIFFDTHGVFLYGDLNAHLEAMKLAEVLSEISVEFEFIPARNCTPAYMAKYRAVIVPQVQWMNAATLQGLATYAEAGGTLLISGACASTDDRGDARPADQNPLAAPEGKLPLSRALGQGQIVHYQCYPITRNPAENDYAKSFNIGPFDMPAWRAAMDAARLDPATLSLLAKPQPHVGTARWVRSDGNDATVTVHLLSYGTPLGITRRNEVSTVHDIELRVPLPAGMTATSAKVSHPQYMEEPVTTELQFRSEPGVVTLTVPELTVYQLVEIIARKAPQ